MAAKGAEALAGILDVSRETAERLERYVALLGRWQKVQNLVAPSTLADAWTRHVADSAQLVALAPADARSWLDLGSGAGFPGLVAAICCAERPGFAAELVEANGRKAAFLRAVIRETGAPARVHNCRIEDFSWPHGQPPDVISARALAPLATLLRYARPFMGEKTVAILPKGREFESELKTALHEWNLDLVIEQSAVERDGRIIVVRAMTSTRTGQG
jgi:16S rRNA (guanine527-N7)-methyltransferase